MEDPSHIKFFDLFNLKKKLVFANRQKFLLCDAPGLFNGDGHEQLSV